MSGTKVSIKYGFGKPQTGSLKKAELAIDLQELSLWTAESDGSEPVRVAHDTTDIEVDLDGLNRDAVLKSVTTLQSIVGAISAKSFDGDGSRITGIITDQLADVNSAGAVRDDLLIYNGTGWEATDFAFIETKLRFQGAINATTTYPADVADGDLYVNNTNGTVSSSYTGIAGTPIIAGNFIGYASSKSRWYLLGDLASSAVTNIGAGTGIDVDDSKATEPVVSIDRASTDVWYEASFTKNTAFNKAFGTGAGQVAEGNHLHSQYLTSSTQAVKSVNGKTGTVVLTYTDVGAQVAGSYAAASHTHSYSPLGHTHSEYAPVSHTHSYAPTSHTHAISQISGGTSAGSAAFYFNSAVDCKKSLTVSGGALTTSQYISAGGYIKGTEIRGTGDVIAYYSSDNRLKDNMRDIESVLDKVCQIRSIEFEWNDNQTTYEGTDVGVSAQSVQAVFPSLVKERELDGYLGVRYEKLAGPVIGAISELRDMVTALQSEVAELKSKLGDQ